MRAGLLLLLLLAVIAFVSFYGSALRPYWEHRLPRVVSHVSEGEFREAASAMVEDLEDAPAPSMVVASKPNATAEPDTSREAGRPEEPSAHLRRNENENPGPPARNPRPSPAARPGLA